MSNQLKHKDFLLFRVFGFWTVGTRNKSNLKMSLWDQGNCNEHFLQCLDTLQTK